MSPVPSDCSASLRESLVSHEAWLPAESAERTDTRRVIDLLANEREPWSRDRRVHLTASAVIVHPSTERVLLRWHERLGFWAHVGGHADPGESEALSICLREAIEETGITDLRPLTVPGQLAEGAILQVAVVPVPGRGSEAAHEHADIRFLLATGEPEAARPESEAAPIRWLPFDEALEVIGADNLRVAVERARMLLGGV